MASIQRPASSGSDGAELVIDERKRKRMLSNRESARRSRVRKQKQVEDLTNEISRLQGSNSQLVQIIKAKEEAYNETDAANNILRVRTMELADRLLFLNSILEIAGEVSGSAEIPEIPDPLWSPLQISYQIQPIMASADMFH